MPSPANERSGGCLADARAGSSPSSRGGEPILEWLELPVLVEEGELSSLVAGAVGPLIAQATASGLAARGYYLSDRSAARYRARIRLEAERVALPVMVTALRGLIQQADLECETGEPESVPSGELTALRGVFEGPAARELFQDFLCEAVPLMASMHTRIAYLRGARAAIAFDLMVATLVALNKSLFAAVRDRPYPTAFLSYRSHADGAFVASKDAGTARAIAEAGYRNDVKKFHGRIQGLLAQLTSGGPAVSEFAGSWAALAEHAARRVTAEIAGGAFRVVSDETGWIGDRADVSTSAIHRTINSNTGIQEFVKHDVEVQAMRAVLALQYWVLHDLGLTFGERCYLCHAISRSFESLYHVDPVEVLSTVYRLGGERHRGAPSA